MRNMEVTGEWRVEGGGGRGGSDLRVEAVPPGGRGGWRGAVVAVEHDVPTPAPRGAGGPPNGRTLSGCSRRAVRESTCSVGRSLLPHFFSRPLSPTGLIYWLTRAAARLLGPLPPATSLCRVAEANSMQFSAAWRGGGRDRHATAPPSPATPFSTWPQPDGRPLATGAPPLAARVSAAGSPRHRRWQPASPPRPPLPPPGPPLPPTLSCPSPRPHPGGVKGAGTELRPPPPVGTTCAATGAAAARAVAFRGAAAPPAPPDGAPGMRWPSGRSALPVWSAVVAPQCPDRDTEPKARAY